MTPDLTGLSYIVILHQTTTYDRERCRVWSCHISLFYIKPQLPVHPLWYLQVVIYRYSTSNHNENCNNYEPEYVVIYRYSTSNHNYHSFRIFDPTVVIYRYSTSNHNQMIHTTISSVLSYIVILHQTTTYTSL